MNTASILDTLVVIASEQSGRVAIADALLVDELGFDSLDCAELGLIIESTWPLVGEFEYDSTTMSTVRQVAAAVEAKLRLAIV